LKLLCGFRNSLRQVVLAHGIDKRFDGNLRAVGKPHAQKLCRTVFVVGIPDWRVESGRHGIECGAIADLNMLFALVVGIAETPERRNLNFDFAPASIFSGRFFMVAF
jgi:hypothetical protein